MLRRSSTGCRVLATSAETAVIGGLREHTDPLQLLTSRQARIFQPRSYAPGT